MVYLYLHMLKNRYPITNLPTGVSGPSFNLITISERPSIRKRGGLFAATIWMHTSNQNTHSIHILCPNFKRTLGGVFAFFAKKRTLAFMAHLWHWILLFIVIKNIFPVLFFARFHREKIWRVQYGRKC